MSNCTECGYPDPETDRESLNRTRARHAVFEAWKGGEYAPRLGALSFFDALAMVDDAIDAVRTSDAGAPNHCVKRELPPPVRF
jgi:hypothetical protein